MKKHTLKCLKILERTRVTATQQGHPNLCFLHVMTVQHCLCKLEIDAAVSNITTLALET